MQPYDYAIKSENPLDAYFSGYKGGLQMQEDRAILQQKQLAMTQAQEAAARQRQLAEQTQGLLAKIQSKTATPEDYAAMRVLMPKDQSEQLTKLFDSMQSIEQQSTLTFGTQVMAALDASPAVAIELLNEKATAFRNKGDVEKAKAYETAAKIAKMDPARAQMVMGQIISSLPGGDKAIKGITDLQANRREEALQPSKLTKAEQEAKKTTSEAEIAAIKSGYADEVEKLGIDKTKVDIDKLKNDMVIAKENARIAAAQVAASMEGDALRREELGLKIEEMKEKRNTTIRERVAEVSDARSGMDMLSNNIYKALAVKDNVIRAALGPVDSRLPTLQNDVSDFEELIATIKSGVFLSSAQKMKGLGALSEKEGEQLMNAMGSLSLRQSPQQITSTLKEIDRLTQKGRKVLAEKYGVPDTPRDVPNAPKPSEEETIDLVNLYTGGA
jgi:hypothetical protein